MKARFGRDIYCQQCGKDDKIIVHYLWQHTYHYRCTRCHVKVREVNREQEAPKCFGHFDADDKCHECEWKPECFYMPGSWAWRDSPSYSPRSSGGKCE